MKFLADLIVGLAILACGLVLFAAWLLLATLATIDAIMVRRKRK